MALTVNQLIAALQQLEREGFGFAPVGVDTHEDDILAGITKVGVPRSPAHPVELRFEGQSELPRAGA